MAGAAERQRQLRQRRKERGVCINCGNERGQNGTGTMCRTCADKTSSRTRELNEERYGERRKRGLCTRCGNLPGEDGTKTLCRPCADRANAANDRHKEKHGKPCKAYVCVDGVCVTCGKDNGNRDGYSACETCNFKVWAYHILGSFDRWTELKTVWDRQGGICPYTGIQLEIGVDASPDHIKPISRFPELKDDLTNIEFIQHQINFMKRDATKEEFLDIVRLIGLNLHLIEEESPWAESLRPDED